MSLQIISEGSSIRLMGNNHEKLVQKSKIVNISVISEQVIRMDMEDFLQTILLRHETITLPNTPDASGLAAAINLMITDCVCSKACDCGIR